ncbi:hypothetical protein MTBUT4_1100001 [Magnetospirillum sp. UT-4]|nr:hypothetical protein MTBUT4_1100001 [Magnetospirillum sp. UT-4]
MNIECFRCLKDCMERFGMKILFGHLALRCRGPKRKKAPEPLLGPDAFQTAFPALKGCEAD